jgi:hypothetical protein
MLCNAKLCYAVDDNGRALLLAYVARDGRRPTSMGLSGGENQEVLERQAKTAVPAASACTVHVCKSTRVEQRAACRPGEPARQKLEGQ